MAQFDQNGNPVSGYSGTTGYNDVFNALRSSLSGASQNDLQNYGSQVSNYTNTFKSLFSNLVGRAPTDDEANTFFENFIKPNTDQLRTPGSAMTQDVNNQIQSFVGANYQTSAKDYATQQLQQQQGQAQDLSNQFRTQGQQALDSTSQYLQNYQTQLWNRLQPQIMLSMQSQGLGNTGGYNEAMAGAQKDLAAQTQGYLADANLQMQNQANQIAFGGAAAPYYYKQGNIMNQVPYMQQMGQMSANNNYNTFMNQLQYQNQLGLQNNYFQNMQNSQPSFLRTLGQGFASSLGNSAGQWAGPQAMSGGGNSAMSGAKALLG